MMNTKKKQTDAARAQYAPKPRAIAPVIPLENPATARLTREALEALRMPDVVPGQAIRTALNQAFLLGRADALKKGK